MSSSIGTHRAPAPEPGPRFVLPFRVRQLPTLRWPVVVVGCGAAGAAAALAAAEENLEVLVLRKAPAAETNTSWAQGGIAAAVGEDDSVELHAEDTLRVGCGLADPDVVSFLTGLGGEAVAWLESLGVGFDQKRAHARRELTLEGGHCRSRVLSADGDSTGRAIQDRLEEAIAAHPLVTVRSDLRAIDLFEENGRCIGLLALGPHGELMTVLAGATVLATGALGQIFRETTNPTAATGDGVAMAFRAGVELQDLEFVQFHPTTLYIAGAARVLISEAVRGAGAVLVDREGDRVMKDKHPDLDLAPRDVVSRAILARMVATGDTHVYLDASRVSEVEARFPYIARMCKAFGIDVTTRPIPVRPGAHYMIGGIRTDLDARTSLASLFACGEVAATGVHGANRLASNSLLDALVMGRVAGRKAAATSGAGTGHPGDLDRIEGSRPRIPSGEANLNLDDMLYSLKSMMWRQVGLVREAFPLRDAEEKIRFWEDVLLKWPAATHKFVDVANMLLVSRLVGAAALLREESRGTHYRLDFPDQDDESWRRRIIVQREGG